MTTAAGILFTDGSKVLAGYHPSLSAWSGIGGKAEEGEPTVSTAIRECCEEVFGLKPDVATLDEIAALLCLGEPIIQSEYALFKADLEALLSISQILEKNGYTCQLYQSFPTTLLSLIESRQAPETAEIRDLTLMPLSELESSRESMAPEFYQDLKNLLSLSNA
jgi:8-oxo-dGTP pyrophosphatase MutT (NUDIX family)